MEIFANFLNKERKEVVRSVLNTIRLCFSSNLTENSVKFILSKKFRNVAGRENIVEVNQEFVFWNLRVSQNKESWLTNNTSLHKCSLNIDLEIILTVI